MWPFKTEEVSSSCPDGAIHVWEYNGQYYRTKDLRDKAELYAIQRKKKIDYIDAALFYINRRSDFSDTPRRDNIPECIYRDCISILYDLGFVQRR